jgi:hypothetical protein
MPPWPLWAGGQAGAGERAGQPTDAKAADGKSKGRGTGRGVDGWQAFESALEDVVHAAKVGLAEDLLDGLSLVKGPSRRQLAR